MDKSQRDTQVRPPHLEQKKLIEFLESLHRIVKIGIYYPAGHKVLDNAAEQFKRNISEIADINRSAHIKLQGEILFVEGYEISTMPHALLEFRQIMQDLGIGAIEIDRVILLPELLQFVRSLLFGRSQLKGIKEFTKAEIANLPPSVRIIQKEFLVDENAAPTEGNNEDAQNGLNNVFDILTEQGLEPGKIEQCKKFLNDLSRKFSNQSLSVKGLPALNWNDVQGLIVKVVSNAYQLSGNSEEVFAQNELNILSSIFHDLGKTEKDEDSQETINLLVSVFGGNTFQKQNLYDDPAKLKKLRPADHIPVQTINQLQSFIKDNSIPRKALEKINQIDRCEELAILLQLLQFKQNPTVENKIRQNLRDILTSPLNVREMETLTMGARHLAACTDRFYDAMQFLSILLRNAKSLSSQQFLAAVCQKISPEAQSHLWPILINEILASGRSIDRRIFSELVLIAAGLSGSEMKERWPELEALDCFQEKKIAADIFDPKLKNAFPLYAFLLETTLKRQIGARILSRLTESPPDWLIEAVAPLIQLSLPQHSKFLQIYLLVAQQKNLTVNIRVAAGTLTVQQLPEISEQQMNEAWVVRTIQATPKMQVVETRKLLEHIIGEKRLYIIPKWPNACRKSAIVALGQLKRKPLE
ncbi:MAG: hypothetical protein WBB23_06075 [Desulforhopalus sp.]